MTNFDVVFSKYPCAIELSMVVFSSGLYLNEMECKNSAGTLWSIVSTREGKNKLYIELIYNMDGQKLQSMHQQTSGEQTEEQSLKSDHVDRPLKQKKTIKSKSISFWRESNLAVFRIAWNLK